MYEVKRVGDEFIITSKRRAGKGSFVLGKSVSVSAKDREALKAAIEQYVISERERAKAA